MAVDECMCVGAVIKVECKKCNLVFCRECNRSSNKVVICPRCMQDQGRPVGMPIV